jgi:hypothetical protein
MRYKLTKRNPSHCNELKPPKSSLGEQLWRAIARTNRTKKEKRSGAGTFSPLVSI